MLIISPPMMDKRSVAPRAGRVRVKKVCQCMWALPRSFLYYVLILSFFSREHSPHLQSPAVGLLRLHGFPLRTPLRLSLASLRHRPISSRLRRWNLPHGVGLPAAWLPCAPPPRAAVASRRLPPDAGGANLRLRFPASIPNPPARALSRLRWSSATPLKCS
jgi:hypothetical protein